APGDGEEAIREARRWNLPLATPTALAYSPDMTVLMVGTEEGRLFALDLVGGTEPGGRNAPHLFYAAGRQTAGRDSAVGIAVAFSADGNLLATRGRDGFLRLWTCDQERGWLQPRLVRAIAGTSSRTRLAPSGLAFHPVRSLLAAPGDGDQDV